MIPIMTSIIAEEMLSLAATYDDAEHAARRIVAMLTERGALCPDSQAHQ